MAPTTGSVELSPLDVYFRPLDPVRGATMTVNERNMCVLSSVVQAVSTSVVVGSGQQAVGGNVSGVQGVAALRSGLWVATSIAYAKRNRILALDTYGAFISYTSIACARLAIHLNLQSNAM